jgi:hypothetical protein
MIARFAGTLYPTGDSIPIQTWRTGALHAPAHRPRAPAGAQRRCTQGYEQNESPRGKSLRTRHVRTFTKT